MTIASLTGLAHPKAGQSRIASAWDEAYAATLDEPQLLL